MATFKAVVLKHQVRNDATLGIKIRVTHNRRSKYINTDLVVTKEDVTRGFKLKNHFFIDETEKMIKKYREVCNKNAHELKDMDIGKVMDLITQIEKTETFSMDIIEYGMKHVDNLLSNGKNKTAAIYKSSLKNLVKFVGRDEVDINEITAKFLKDWILWIDGTMAKSRYPVYIKKLHGDAKREYNIEELGVIKIPLSPFSVVKIPKDRPSKHIDIPVGKVRELFNLEEKKGCKKSSIRYNFAHDMFMLSFCLWGTNAKDLYECTDFKDGRITYNRAKTKDRRGDAALISIKIEPEIMPLVEKYRDKTGERAFCFYQMFKDADKLSHAISYGMNKIREDIGIDYLVYYSARHSFATIATNDVGINEYVVHKMLNHVLEEMKITEKYVRKDWRPLDEANRKLLDFVFEKQITTELKE